MSTKATTYNGSADAKAHHATLSALHAESDRLVSGSYGDQNTGLGCSVGCHAMDYGLDSGDHVGLADKLGWPAWLVYLQDRIFEGLPPTHRGAWHVALAEAVPVGADLRRAYHRIMSRMLREVSWPASRPDDAWGCAVAVRRVAGLHDRSAADPAAYSAARSAARSADSAARSAAYSARSAAYSARSAAYSAYSAYSAAYAAAYSATYAADSAAYSADSADSAAYSAAYQQIRDIILTEVARAD